MWTNYASGVVLALAVYGVGLLVGRRAKVFEIVVWAFAFLAMIPLGLILAGLEKTAVAYCFTQLVGGLLLARVPTLGNFLGQFVQKRDGGRDSQ